MAWTIRAGGRSTVGWVDGRDRLQVELRWLAQALGLQLVVDDKAKAVDVTPPAPPAPSAPAPPAVATPCPGPVTNPFGPAGGPYGNPWGWHLGIDIGVPVGTRLVAPRAGMVELVGDDPEGLGLHLVLRHGADLTVYGHLSVVALEAGETVEAGWPIARSGNTGQSTGPHLHFEVWLGCKGQGGDVYQLTRHGGGLPADPAVLWRGEWPTQGVPRP